MTHLGQPRGYSAAVLPPYNRAKAKRSRKASKLAREFIALSLDDRVLTVRMWAVANGISFSTARRILREGNGPPLVQLSERRFGIRVSDNRKWQDSRLVASSGDEK